MSDQRRTRSPSRVERMAHWTAGNWPWGTTARSLSVPTSLPLGSMTRRCWISDRYGMSREMYSRPRFVRAPARRVWDNGDPMSPTPEAGLRVRAFADQAVAAALDADWVRAFELN